MFINTGDLEERINTSHVSARPHPSLPIKIYNYTPLCQFEQKWDDVTLACRGLVLDEHLNVIARPFKKFFNIEEYHDKLPSTLMTVTEKMDGSLGILFKYQNQLVFATRGSFESDQAKEMEKIWHEKYQRFPILEGYTYLFEIIYPENRIVVDYGQERKLVLLAVIETATGREIDVSTSGFPDIVKEYYFGDIDQLRETLGSLGANFEGFVVLWKDSGLRLKVKSVEYLRLHRIITETTTVTIWEALSQGKELVSILDDVPDEFYDWVKETSQNLTDEFVAEGKKAISLILPDIPEFWKLDRKAAVKYLFEESQKRYNSNFYAHLAFMYLDGYTKDFNETIWKHIRPAYSKPFWRTDGDCS